MAAPPKDCGISFSHDSTTQRLSFHSPTATPSRDCPFIRPQLHHPETVLSLSHSYTIQRLSFHSPTATPSRDCPFIRPQLHHPETVLSFSHSCTIQGWCHFTLSLTIPPRGRVILFTHSLIPQNLRNFILLELYHQELGGGRVGLFACLFVFCHFLLQWLPQPEVT